MNEAYPTAPLNGADSHNGATMLRTRLRILATTDLHSHILPWDYDSDTPNPTRGFARTAALIAAARAEGAVCLLLDNGDFLQGSALADHAAQRPGIHPMIAAMNLMGYDAAAVGNHEFSLGLPLLEQARQDAAFPLLSANLFRALGPTPAEDTPFLPAEVMLDRRLSDGNGHTRPIRIGIIAFTPPQTTTWDQANLAGSIVARGILETAAYRVPRLRAAGADIVIALSHSGLGPADATDDSENVSAALARLPGIDAVVAGHTHLAYPDTPTAGSPIVLPGHHGSHLGVIDLALTHGPKGWRITRATSHLRPIATRDSAGPQPLTASHPAVEALVQADHAATRAATARPIGTLPHRLHSYFALVADCPALRLVAEAQAAWVRTRLQGRAESALPLISAVAPFKTGGRGGPDAYTDVPAGPIALRHAADLYMHPNQITALRLTGADLADWLERAAGQFCTLPPGSQDTPLLDPEFPSFNFEILYGLTWQIDLSRPARFDLRGQISNPHTHRITDLRHNGRPVDPAQPFIVATNSYRSSGSGGFAGANEQNLILSGPETVRDELVAHLRRTPHPTTAPTWRFAPQPGTTALFPTSPRALPLLADALPTRLTEAGPAPGGFHNIRLHL